MQELGVRQNLWFLSTQKDSSLFSGCPILPSQWVVYLVNLHPHPSTPLSPRAFYPARYSVGDLCRFIDLKTVRGSGILKEGWPDYRCSHTALNIGRDIAQFLRTCSVQWSTYMIFRCPATEKVTWKCIFLTLTYLHVEPPTLSNWMIIRN